MVNSPNPGYRSPENRLRDAIDLCTGKLESVFSYHRGISSIDPNSVKANLEEYVPELELLVAGGETIPYAIGTAAYELREFARIALSERCDWSNAVHFGMIYEKYQKHRIRAQNILQQREKIRKESNGGNKEDGEGWVQTSV